MKLFKSKKTFAFLLAALLAVSVLALAACKPDEPDPTPTPTPTPEKESYQLVGHYDELAASYGMNFHFLMNLKDDGIFMLSSYNSGSMGGYDHSAWGENAAFTEEQDSGTWKKAKDAEGEDCVQIKTTKTTTETYYAYADSAGKVILTDFKFLFMGAYTRYATLEGTKTKTYADYNAFIQAFKEEEPAPQPPDVEAVAVFAFSGGGNTLTLTLNDDDTCTLVGMGQNKTGTWSYDDSDDVYSVVIDGDAAPYTSTEADGIYTIVYTVANYPISLTYTAPEPEPEAVAVFEFDAGGFGKLTLTLNDGGSCTLVGMGQDKTGTWSYNDGDDEYSVVIDGDDAPYTSTEVDGTYTIVYPIASNNISLTYTPATPGTEV